MNLGLSLILLHDISSVTIRLVMLCVVPQLHNPSTAMAWLLVIFFWPLPGLALYLVFGSFKLPKKRIARHEQILTSLDRSCCAIHEAERPKANELPPELLRFALLGEKLGDMPPTRGNTAELIDSAETMARLLASDIDSARHHVNLLYYIFASDFVTKPVLDALERASGRGVSCRLLVDALGSGKFLKKHAPPLREAGVKVVGALPLSMFRRNPLSARFDLRNHRKLAVIDGRTGYMGSHNMTEPSYGGKAGGLLWKDLTLRVEGPEVLQLQRVFLEDWFVETGELVDERHGLPLFSHHGGNILQTVPSGPSYRTENYQRLVVTALHCAEKEVIITTPYLIPDDSLMEGLEVAVLNGASVNLVIPKRSDQFFVGNAAKAYYDILLDKGVRIFLYDDGVIHAKTMTVDGNLCFFGSSNFDIRSFALNFELNCVLYGEMPTSMIREAQIGFIDKSRPLLAEEWEKRPFAFKTVEGIAKLLSPLL
ncbi:MAG: cardiolipin synthase [Thermovirgaceae bacterium]|nr:cardiolipin synthase [Thermovirgaceae bacterium]